MFGIINIYKEKGMTSFDVIAKLRKILKEKKIGHTGTLDPNATGVLPICIGNATKLSQYILNQDKEYYAVVRLGIKTDTGDITGNVINNKDIPKLTIGEIKTIIDSFIGTQKQLPPMYSAIKINGQKLYDLARKGIEVEREERNIEIREISNINYSIDKQEISFIVSCSKGTYIRTLAEQIAEKLGTVGTIIDLERTKTGVFTKETSYTLNQITELVDSNNIEKALYNIENIFNEYPSIDLSQYDWKAFLNGVKFNIDNENGMYTLYYNSQFKGLGKVQNKQIKREVILEE